MRPGDSIAIPASGDAKFFLGGSAASERACEHMDEATFVAFYRETAPALRAFLKHASGNAALADDILQETFYRFLRADLPQPETRPVKSYLYRTAHSLLVDHWRRVNRERRWSVKNFLGSEASTGPETGGDAMTVFRGLKPREQSLLWLAYVEGYDHREIAAALGLSERSVRVLLSRARKKLAGVLKKRGLGPREER